MSSRGEFRVSGARYGADGTLRDRVPLPVPQVTSCAFAGPDLTTLYVTTATEHYTDERRAAEPLAGRVFRLPGAGRGVPVRPFRAGRGALAPGVSPGT